MEIENSSILGVETHTDKHSRMTNLDEMMYASPNPRMIPLEDTMSSSTSVRKEKSESSDASITRPRSDSAEVLQEFSFPKTFSV